jgi:hypothetical protein
MSWQTDQLAEARTSRRDEAAVAPATDEQEAEESASRERGLRMAEASGAVQRQAAPEAAGRGRQGERGPIVLPETVVKLPAEDWDTAMGHAADSFLNLLLSTRDAVRYWEGLASAKDPLSPNWKDLLLFASTSALTGIFGSLVSSAVQSMLAEPTDAVGQVMEAAHGKANDVLSEGVRSVLSRDGVGQELALVEFVNAQVKAYRDAGFEAQGRFRTEAGSSENPKLSVAQLQEIRKRNLELIGDVETFVVREMTMGWVSLLGGSEDPIEAARLSNVGNAGTLGIEVVGREGVPVAINRARVKGLGPGLRKKIRGTEVRDWMARGGKETGLNIVITTHNDFLLSDEDRERLVDAGAFGDPRVVRGNQEGHRDTVSSLDRASGRLARAYVDEQRKAPENAHRLGSINFGVGLRPDGSFQYVSDFGGGWFSDNFAGYTAGRQFLEEKGYEWLFRLVSSLRIGDVES